MTVAVARSRSARGEAALRAAAAEAVRRNEDLAVLHIVPGVDEAPPDSPAFTEEVTGQLTDFPDLVWSLHSGPEGWDTADGILELADDVNATLLVLGSRKRRPVSKLLLGSVVQRVILDAQIPVLVVKAS